MNGYEPPNDFKHLLKKAKAGDERAWETLYLWLAPQVLGFFRAGRTRDPEDVLGDVFLDVARRIGDFRGDSRGFRAWVFTIARSRRIDDIRRRSRQREDRLDTAEQAVIPSSVDVERDALGSLVLDDLLAYLDFLTDDQAEVLILRALGGWTSPEIAEITGRSVGSVEQLHHRACRSLREILTNRKESMPGFGPIA
jgi:RNA polymerase sigma-70 factor (ECF subfamily)